MRLQWILASDIDNTLTGNLQASERLRRRLGALQKEGTLFLILSTGRQLHQVLEGFEHEAIPAADAIVSQVGTEIYLPPFSVGTPALQEWDALLHDQFSRNRALKFLTGIDGVEMQSEDYNTPLKVSCFLDKAPDPEGAADLITRRVADERHAYQVVWSSGKHLDIIPAAAGKGKAIQFLIRYLQLSPQQVIVAGDSGNDRSMFDEFACGIIVANAQPELIRLTEGNPQSFFYLAQNSFAAGVAEGLLHFGVLSE